MPNTTRTTLHAMRAGVIIIKLVCKVSELSQTKWQRCHHYPLPPGAFLLRNTYWHDMLVSEFASASLFSTRAVCIFHLSKLWLRNSEGTVQVVFSNSDTLWGLEKFALEYDNLFHLLLHWQKHKISFTIEFPIHRSDIVGGSCQVGSDQNKARTKQNKTF